VDEQEFIRSYFLDNQLRQRYSHKAVTSQLDSSTDDHGKMLEHGPALALDHSVGSISRVYTLQWQEDLPRTVAKRSTSDLLFWKIFCQAHLVNGIIQASLALYGLFETRRVTKIWGQDSCIWQIAIANLFKRDISLNEVTHIYPACEVTPYNTGDRICGCLWGRKNSSKIRARGTGNTTSSGIVFSK